MGVADPITQAQFYERMQMFDEKLQDMHRRQREHVDARFGQLQAVFEKHEEDDRAIERRVAVIEIERKTEERQAQKAGALYGVMAGAGVNALVMAVKKMLGWES